MIRYENGDLLQSQSAALVNAVNCQGVMGKGIAYQFKEKFPKNFEVYKNACKNGQFKIGDVLIVSENNKLIVNFPTKDTWKRKSLYEYITIGLDVLKKEIISRKITSISIPPLGCGNGGLEWTRVESLIIEVLGDLNGVDVVLFPPVTKENLADKKELISVRHLLVVHAFKNLRDKKRYSLNTLFYLSQKISGYNYFNFTIKHNRLFSSDLEQVTKDIKSLKERYGTDFYSFIDDYINTHQSKDMEVEFRRLIPSLKLGIGLLNLFETKEEFVVIADIFEKILDNGSELIIEARADIDDDIRNFVLQKMVDADVIQNNMFGQYEIIKPL